MEIVFLALGSNMGDRALYLHEAVESIKKWGSDFKASPLYETKPVGYDQQGSFLNMAVCLRTSFDPLTLLQQCQALEQSARRVRTIVNGPRTLDVDILFFGHNIITLDLLSIPHPRLSERDFVLRPLLDIDPDWLDPVSQNTIQELWDAYKAKRGEDNIMHQWLGYGPNTQ